MSEPDDFGFKRLTAENWLKIDPAWVGEFVSNSQGGLVESWIHDLLQINLSLAVPTEIRKQFEVARGALIYSLVYYPFLAFGMEQICRVAESASQAKCASLNAPYKKVERFVDRIAWLGENKIIHPEDTERWTAIRHLRNDASHPRDQKIANQAMMFTMIEAVVELVDGLFEERPS